MQPVSSAYPPDSVSIVAEVVFDDRVQRARVRPVSGEVFGPELKIECARQIREYPVGTRVRMRVARAAKQGRGQWLYSSNCWPHSVLQRDGSERSGESGAA